MHVVFFDIDGTLISTGGSGIESLRRAYSEVFDRPPPQRIETSGRTDRGIARAMLLDGSLPDTGENWRCFHEAYLRHLVDLLPLKSGCVLPGVAELIEALLAREDVAVGLLTGNTPEGAMVKLQHFGLHDRFPFGGYGDRSVDRTGVAVSALEAARERLNGQLDEQRVWVVGDTPLDIRCARHIAAKSVGVATGMHPREELAAESPDLLWDDMREGRQLLDLLDGDRG